MAAKQGMQGWRSGPCHQPPVAKASPCYGTASGASPSLNPPTPMHLETRFSDNREINK